MKKQKIVSYILLVSFLSHTTALAEDLPIPSFEKTEISSFSQRWGSIDPSQNKISESVLFTNSEGKKNFFPLTLYPNKGLAICDPQNNIAHYIEIPMSQITLSKHYLFIIPTSEFHGFFILRQIDILSHAFHSEIPLYFIPIEQAEIKKITITHNEQLQEEHLFLQKNNTTADIVDISFQEIEYILKLQMMRSALLQFHELAYLSSLKEVVSTLNEHLKHFYEDLTTTVKNMVTGQHRDPLLSTLKEISSDKDSSEKIVLFLQQLENKKEWSALKHEFTRRYIDIIDTFHVSYDEAMKKIPLSTVSISNPLLMLPALTHLPSSSEKEPISDISRAKFWYLGLTSGLLLLTFGLPKFCKKSFSQLGAELTQFYCFRLTRPITRFLTRWGITAEENQGVKITAEQFWRAFLQTTADTGTVLLVESLTRPLYRETGEASVENAILTNQPFTETHTLWWQKNFLYDIIHTQILDTLSRAVSLAEMEKELLNVIQEHIVEPHLEALIPQKFSKAQIEILGQRMVEDLDILKRWITQKLPTVPSLPTGELHRIRENWITCVEKLMSKEKLSPANRTALAHVFDAKLMAAAEIFYAKLRAPSSAQTAICQKISQTLSRVIGATLEARVRATWKQSMNVWVNLLEPSAWEMLYLQLPVRRSANLTMFAFDRITSLLLFCPLYILTYSLKRKWTKPSSTSEVAYGLIYGFITSFIYQYLFLNLYEKPLLGTQYDLEFSKYYEHYFGDGRPLDNRK